MSQAVTYEAMLGAAVEKALNQAGECA